MKIKKRLLLIVLCICTFILCSCGSKDNKKEDGIYNVSVALEGGTGKATLMSPSNATIKDGNITVELVWSSPNYDYMIVDDVRYDNLANAGENSRFVIPVTSIPCEINVIADTTAMSVPHEIEYKITINYEEADFSKMEVTDELELRYAIGYTAKWYGLYCYISIPDSGNYLVVPEDMQVPVNLPSDTIILKKPLNKTYLAASSQMDMICSLNADDNITLSGIKENDWYIEKAKDAMKNGTLLYAGKYSVPDYELILANDCNLAIESTMIYHTPEVKEKLEELDIPVLVERSSYETHPLGRMEWIKLYGILYDSLDEAISIYDNELEEIEAVLQQKETGKTIAFFYVNGNGVINVRKPNDYIAKMINIAGGKYILDDMAIEEDNALSTMNMQMEDFYVKAKDADYIIYNSAIEGELSSLSDLIKLNNLFSDFKAVKNGNVYCTSGNYFQETMGTCKFIEDVNNLLTGNTNEEFKYIKHLE